METNDNTDLSLSNNILNFNRDRKYWLVRTMGGDFFDEFNNRGYIAIGYNEISLNEIKFASTKDKEAVKTLKEIADIKMIGKTSQKDVTDEEDSDAPNTQYAAIQMLKFVRDIEIGDIIIIPGKSSDMISIGYITSNVYTEDKISNLSGTCQYTKRRNVKFVKKVSRLKLNPKMQLMFNSRHIISNVDPYAEYIDSNISDFYKKGDKTYLVLRVKQENEISATDITLIGDLLNLLDEFSEQYNYQISSEDIKIKLCVQSPGDILMYAFSWEGIAILGLIIMLIKGGEFTCNRESGLKIKTNDLLATVSSFLDRMEDRKIKKSLRKKLDNMDIETPEDLNSVINELNKNREKY